MTMAMPVFDDDGNDGIAVRRTGLHRSVGAVRATQLCYLGGAVAGRSLPWHLRRQASSVVVGGGKALGLSSGIVIVVALDRARILLDERFDIHADPHCSGNDDGGGDDDNEDNYNYTMGDLLSLAASFRDGVGADAQIPADNIISWQFRTECV